MNNNPIQRIADTGIIPLQQPQQQRAGSIGESFGDVLGKFVNDVNTLQHQADQSIDKLATGEITDVHEVMIAVEEANTAMEFMLEIRNKIVEAYQEVMRMPV